MSPIGHAPDRSCPTCWCPGSLLDDPSYDTCKFQRAAEVFAKVDAERDQLLDDDENVEKEMMKEAEKRLKHQL